VTEAGTYLDATDLAKLGTATGSPKIRRYKFRDTWGKIRSRAGAQLAFGAVATLATAIVGVVLAVTAASPAPTVDVATVESVLAWTRAPLDQLRSTPTSSAASLDAARRTVDSRITVGDDCLALLQGEEAPPATIPGVTCTAPSTSSWSAQIRRRRHHRGDGRAERHPRAARPGHQIRLSGQPVLTAVGARGRQILI
jgi:hypothetical protein